MKAETCLKIAGIAGATGVAAGAFGAHALKGGIAEDLLEIYHTGAFYHLIHSIALLAIASLIQRYQMTKILGLSAVFFAFGILVFSGSLYTLAVSGNRWWGAVTPVGGISLILGWALLFFARIEGAESRASQHNQS